MTKNQIIDRVKELNEASEAYYNTGQPIMSDAEFDQKLEELRQWENETGIVLANSPTQNVGATVLDNIKEVTHKTPMLSLEKCHSVEEIVKFANGHNLVASVKLDGLTVRLTYKDGDLILAESRGNGTVGSDVTEHVKQFTNVPLHINKEGTYIIDGEALIKLDDFAEINKNGEYKNSRNLAAGTLSSLDTSVVKDRKLSWYAWEVVEGSSIDEFQKQLLEAADFGFEIVPNVLLSNVKKDNDLHDDNLAINTCLHLIFNIADNNKLPQDGVVFKFDDVVYGKSLGNTSHHFRNGIAYKIFNDSVETTLRDIEWSCGKTGTLTPVAIFDTVDIEGSEVSRASLHNISVMTDILGDNPWRGQRIGVCKRNLIIPQISWAEQLNGSRYDNNNYNTHNYINVPPVKCPICGQPTRAVKENDSEVLMCENPDCKGKLLGKLVHATSRNALDVKNLSKSTLKKFINLGWLNSIKDIYHLSDHEKEIKTLEGLGKKSVEKLLSSIEKSRDTNLERFLYGLSIPLLGKSTSKMIAEAVDYSFEEFMREMTIEGANYFRNIAGIDNVLIQSLDDYFNKNCASIFQLSKEFTFGKKKAVLPMDYNSTNLTGKTFVITGKLNHYENRDAAKADIETRGGKVTGSVTSKTDYLINNDLESTSGKNKKAKEFGVKIISEDQLLEMLK